MQKTNKKSALRFLSVLMAALMLLTCAAVFPGVSAADDDVYYYVNSETGEDTANGRTAKTARLSLTR
mgnify:CR=1 FL=1